MDKNFLFILALCAPVLAFSAGPKDAPNAADRNDANNRVTNKDGYVDGQRANDKFDPYTQGARKDTRGSLVDSSAAPDRPSSKRHTKPRPDQDAPSRSPQKPAN
ncbi:hypothetical protein [Cupriavidus sp. D39]|uniref:hypothetical protein n=1 Tax=Cupriavidus sp. D39 TaxID=2997877 RepID=UPI002271CD5B|nr:hypothetical protein [Cupriavidus sp. D39]MCY0852627.1 hypothetical protein [Cupriavidus sp. D39]